MARPADHNDADLIIKLYDLRREAVMREARQFMMWEFHPESLEDLEKLLNPKDKHNSHFRQVIGYWEMAASFVNRKILDPKLFADNCWEGLLLYAKMAPYLQDFWKKYTDDFFGQTRSAVADFPEIKDRFERLRPWVRSPQS